MLENVCLVWEGDTIIDATVVEPETSMDKEASVACREIVRIIQEQAALRAENKRLRKENPRYCPKCKRSIQYEAISFIMEELKCNVLSEHNSHICGALTVPIWSEERRRRMRAEEENKRLREALEGLYNHTKNNHTICGLNWQAKQALNPEVTDG